MANSEELDPISLDHIPPARRMTLWPSTQPFDAASVVELGGRHRSPRNPLTQTLIRTQNLERAYDLMGLPHPSPLKRRREHEDAARRLEARLAQLEARLAEMKALQRERRARRARHAAAARRLELSATPRGLASAFDAAASPGRLSPRRRSPRRRSPARSPSPGR